MTPRRRAAATSGNSRPLSSRMPFGAGAYMWVTMSPRLSSGRTARIGEYDWPMWIITGRLNGAAASCARRSASRSLASATFSDNRALTPTTIAMARDRPLRQGDVGGVHVVQLAGGRDNADAGNVHQGAAQLGCCPRDGGDLVDIVRAGRAGIDPAGHAVLQ